MIKQAPFVPLVFSRSKNRKVTWRKYAYKVAQQFLEERQLIEAGDSKSTIYSKRNALLAEARNAIQNNSELFIKAVDWANEQNENLLISRGKAIKLVKKSIDGIHSDIAKMGGSIISLYNINGISYLSRKGEGAIDFITILKNFGVDLTDLLSASCSVTPMKFMIDVANNYAAASSKDSISTRSRRKYK